MSRRNPSKQPYQIKGVDAIFGETSPPQLAESRLSLSQISLPPQQPRRYFDPQAMAELIASVKQYGVLQPLLVRPQGQAHYELVAGERRYRAAASADLESVPVVIRELSDDEAWQLALLENLQREDLNPVEETEGILQLLAGKLNQSVELVISLLNQAAHPERESVDNVIHKPEWQVVLDVFTSVGKFTPESFRTNRLPLLNLPDEIKEALSQGQIAYTKARAISKIKDACRRSAILATAISENLSLSQIQERIKSLEVKESLSPETQPLKGRVDSALRQIKKSKVWDDPQKKRRLEKVLAELEALILGN